MSLINHDELKKQLASGEITSLYDITAEFKNILKGVIQTTSQKELTSLYTQTISNITDKVIEKANEMKL
jgi:hypothetical protein